MYATEYAYQVWEIFLLIPAPLACMYANQEEVQRVSVIEARCRADCTVSLCQNENKVHRVIEARCRIGCLGSLKLDEGQGA